MRKKKEFVPEKIFSKPSNMESRTKKTFVVPQKTFSAGQKIISVPEKIFSIAKKMFSRARLATR